MSAHISDLALHTLIIPFEAPGGPALLAYQDPGGVWTIGYGHTGLDVVPGRAITAQEAEILLAGDLVWFERGVENQLARPVPPCQFDALVSLAYDVGLHGFATVLEAVNTGHTFRAACAFWAYIHDQQGTILPGLVRRRVAEAVWFSGGTPT